MTDPSSPSGPPRPRCRHCDNVIGIYEPLIARGASGDQETSLAADPDCCGPGQDCYHLACFDRIAEGETG
jgi:hypothetical protein